MTRREKSWDVSKKSQPKQDMPVILSKIEQAVPVADKKKPTQRINQYHQSTCQSTTYSIDDNDNDIE